MKNSILRFIVLTTVYSFFSFTVVQIQAQNLVRGKDNTVEFLVVGDWGSGGAGAKRVAKAMATVYSRHGAEAVLSTGDNIYPSGVSDVNDPQWRTKFENIYPVSDLPVLFWAVLGNHDYRKNPDAQVEYSGHTLADGTVTRWRMPGRSWSTSFISGDGKVRVRVVGIDTQQLIAGAEKRKAHLAWIDSALAASDEEWKLVVGHHPVYSHGHYKDNVALKRHLAPVLSKYGVQTYLNGHDHDLQVIKKTDGVRYLISGGGSSFRKTSAGARTEFCAASLGFMRIVCSAEEMLIEVYDSAAKLLFSTTDARQRERAK